MSALPAWLRVEARSYGEMAKVRSVLSRLGVYTVCEGARCPNVFRCWGEGTATFMILGEVCTRSCRFCSVRTGNPRGYVDLDEPRRVAEAVRRLGLRYVVVTSVDRDDLPDGGAFQFASAIREIRRLAPGALVEVLTPDFRGSREAVETVAEAGPDVFAHNVETVRRLTPLVRDRRASYETSLRVLKTAKEVGCRLTKSGIMLGLGESFDEVVEVLDDLRKVEVDIVTIGQYVRPTKSARHLPVARWVPPEEFQKLGEVALSMGFKAVASAPLVRSSYRAEDLYEMALGLRPRAVLV